MRDAGRNGGRRGAGPQESHRQRHAGDTRQKEKRDWDENKDAAQGSYRDGLRPSHLPGRRGMGHEVDLHGSRPTALVLTD